MKDTPTHRENQWTMSPDKRVKRVLVTACRECAQQVPIGLVLAVMGGGQFADVPHQRIERRFGHGVECSRRVNLSYSQLPGESLRRFLRIDSAGTTVSAGRELAWK